MARRTHSLTVVPEGQQVEKQNGRPDETRGELMRFLRVRSTVWCRSAMRAPWGFAIPARPLAAFHLVVSGTCRLDIDGITQPLELHAGDIVIVPNGRAHVARSDSEAEVRYLDDILATNPPLDGRLSYGGGGEETDLVCGGFALTDPAARPLIDVLPAALVLRANDTESDPLIRDVLRSVLRELEAPEVGSETILTRLTDLLLALALRQAVRASAPARGGWRDPLIARAIAAIEQHPERDWTLAQLAATASLSRSAFSERFRDVTGESPMRFLARARLGRAADLLRDGLGSVKEIADTSGFGSEASFSRAFRRYFGKAPRTYRHDNGATVTRT